MECRKILTFSFDDGVTQDERFVEILNEYGLKCTFNLNSDLLGKSGSLTVCGEKVDHTKVDISRVKEIYNGHEVASHTLTHRNLTTLPPEEVVREVESDRKVLSECVGYEVQGFAYPCGGINCNKTVANIIKNETGVKYARSIIHSYTFELPRDRFLLKPTASLTKDRDMLNTLCDKFLADDPENLQLLYIWGHTYELDVNNGWDYFKRVCEKIAAKKDIFYCTNTQAFDFIDEKIASDMKRV